MTNKTYEVIEEGVADKTVEELNIEYAKKDIWEAMPFTASFIERNVKTKEDADCILKKISEHHKEVVNILTQYSQKLVEVTREAALQEAIDLSDQIEQREPDGGTKQWMAFKAFRNTLRDKIKTLTKDTPTED